MAISFVTSGEAAAVSGGDPAITLGATPAADDLILCVGGIGDNDSVDQTMSMTTAGYTLVPSTELFVDNLTRDLNIAVFYKFADGSESTLTFNGLGGADAACAAVALVFRGVDTSNPFDVTSTTASLTDSPNADPPSIDWTTSGTAVVIAGGAAHLIASGTLTAPTNYTTNARDAFQADTTNVTVGMGYRLSPADPENPGAFTHNGTDALAVSAGITMALREFVAPSTTGPGWYGSGTW